MELPPELPSTPPPGVNDLRRFIEGVLTQDQNGAFTLRWDHHAEQVEVAQGQPRVPLGSKDFWVISLPATGLPVVHLDLPNSNKLRAYRRREAERIELEKRVKPPSRSRPRVCERCGEYRRPSQFPATSDVCSQCAEYSPQSTLPDDRDPSTSIRTVRGGAPGLGRRS